MKIILATLTIFLITMSCGNCKPGGWFWDLLDRSSINNNNGYYIQQPVHYTQPIYYNQPVYYRQSPPQVYYTPVPVYYYYPERKTYYKYNCRHNY